MAKANRMAEANLEIKGTAVTTIEPEQSSELAGYFADADTVVITVCGGSSELLDGLVREAAKILSDGMNEPTPLMKLPSVWNSEASRMIPN